MSTTITHFENNLPKQASLWRINNKPCFISTVVKHYTKNLILITFKFIVEDVPTLHALTKNEFLDVAKPITLI